MKNSLFLYLIVVTAQASAIEIPLSNTARLLALVSKELHSLEEDLTLEPALKSEAAGLRAKVGDLWSRSVLIPHLNSKKALAALGVHFVVEPNSETMSLTLNKSEQNLLKGEAHSLMPTRWQNLNQALDQFIDISNQIKSTLYDYRMGDMVSLAALSRVKRGADERQLLPANRLRNRVHMTLDCIDYVDKKLSGLGLRFTFTEDQNIQWNTPLPIAEIDKARRTMIKSELRELVDKAPRFRFTCLGPQHAQLFYATSEQL